jgi:hypothetical protein
MTNDDVTWARAVLGRANPVPAGPTHAAGPVPAGGPTDLPTVAPARPRRRAIVVGALATAAALVAAVVAATALTGGNAGTAHRTPGGTAVLAAAATTEAAKTADISVALTTSGTSVSGQGVADLASGAGDFTVDLPGQLGQLEVLSTGGTVYVRVPAPLTALVGGKAWASVAAPSPNSAQPLTFDATWLLDWLRTVSGPVTTVGSDTVHGDATTHYRATVTIDKSSPAQAVPVDVWVDDAGRLRKLTASLDASTTPLASLGTVQVTAELWGFGTPVNITPPPADQVGDASGLLPAVRQLLGGA